jgi:hypothetical protein
MPTATAAEPLLVTKDELLEIATWERKYAKAKKAQAAAEKAVKCRRMALAEKVLGVKTEDELKALTPAQVEKRTIQRVEAGDWKLERGAPLFAFKKTHQGAYPSWLSLYIGEMGQTAAERISADTPLTYSYCVDVSPL